MILSKQQFKDTARKALLAGVEELYEAVSTTLGPRGNNVAIYKVTPNGDPYDYRVIHDGVEVARHIVLEDKGKDLGVEILKQAAQKQVDEVGDGTTVAIVLAHAFLKEITTLIAAGVNPMLLRKELEQGLEKVIDRIYALSTPITTYQHKKHIATISAEDAELGKLVADVLDEMGATGLVAIEESKNADTSVDKQMGMQIDKGYMHGLFITNPETLEATVEQPYILLTDISINSLSPLKSLLEDFSKKGKRLVIFTPKMSEIALADLLNAKLKGVLQTLVVAAPHFGQQQKEYLQDMAIYTGGRYVTEDAGDSLENVTIDDLGKADYVNATKTDTLIVAGKGKKVDIDERIASITKAIEIEENDFDKEKNKERLARLTSGVAVIKVGGSTEIEMKERLERVKDAVAALKAALRVGIVPGGETIYLHARQALTPSSIANDVLYKALYQPFAKLLQNAGLNDGEYYEKLQHKAFGYGVDVANGEIDNFIKKGIVDPTLVPISALKNALSVAIQLATTGATVVQYAKKNTVT